MLPSPGHRIQVLITGLCSLAACLCPAPAEAGEMLVVAAREEAMESIAPLLEYRRTEGRAVHERLLAEDATETGVAALIAEARVAHPEITHLLLVGTHNSVPMAERPPLLVQMTEPDLPMLTDLPYARAGGSDAPELATGRLPFDDEQTLARVAEKIVRYERDLDSLAPKVFLLAGRQPADAQPVVGRFSPQSLVDGASAQFVAEARAKLAPLRLDARTAFPGEGEYAFDETAAVLAEGLTRRPFLAAYAGHAGRDGLATYHSAWEICPIQSGNVADLPITAVCGLFVSGGCSTLEPGEGPSVGAALLAHPNGPVAYLGYTRINDDFAVMQTLETVIAQVDAHRGERMTIGEFVAGLRGRLRHDPQSPRSMMVRQFMQLSGQLRPEAPGIPYTRMMEKNDTLMMLTGDPATSFLVPAAAAN